VIDAFHHNVIANFCILDDLQWKHFFSLSFASHLLLEVLTFVQTLLIAYSISQVGITYIQHGLTTYYTRLPFFNGGWKSKNPLNRVDKLANHTNFWCALVGLKGVWFCWNMSWKNPIYFNYVWRFCIKVYGIWNPPIMIEEHKYVVSLLLGWRFSFF
jgi:hypothetical protein